MRRRRRSGGHARENPGMRAGCAARWSTLRVFTRVAVDQHAAAQVPTVAAARWRSYLRLEGTYVVARRGEPRLPGRVSCSDALASRVLGFLRRESKTRVVLSWSSAVCVWARDRGSPDSGSRALLAASPIATELRVVHGPKIVLQHPRQKYVLQESFANRFFPVFRILHTLVTI